MGMVLNLCGRPLFELKPYARRLLLSRSRFTAVNSLHFLPTSGKQLWSTGDLPIATTSSSSHQPGKLHAGSFSWLFPATSKAAPFPPLLFLPLTFCASSRFSGDCLHSAGDPPFFRGGVYEGAYGGPHHYDFILAAFGSRGGVYEGAYGGPHHYDFILAAFGSSGFTNSNCHELTTAYQKYKDQG